MFQKSGKVLFFFHQGDADILVSLSKSCPPDLATWVQRICLSNASAKSLDSVWTKLTNICYHQTNNPVTLTLTA